MNITITDGKVYVAIIFVVILLAVVWMYDGFLRLLHLLYCYVCCPRNK